MDPNGPIRESDAEHCPAVDRAAWDDKVFVWNDRPFLKVKVKTVFWVPLDMGKKIRRARAQLEGAGAAVAGGLILMQHRSPWETDLYIDVAGPVPGAQIVTIGGTFMTRVFDGQYRDAPRFAGEMQRHVEGHGKKLHKLYYAWNACPRCAKAAGRNSCVVFAEV